jgi:hypothetical protein
MGPARWLHPRTESLGAALTLFSCVSPTAHALSLITEDTGTQGAGIAQIELTATQERDRDGDTTTHRFDPTVVFTYDVVDPIDVFVSAPHLRLRSDGAGERSAADSLGRMELSAGVKGKLNSAAPDQAFLFGVTWHRK